MKKNVLYVILTPIHRSELRGRGVRGWRNISVLLITLAVVFTACTAGSGGGNTSTPTMILPDSDVGRAGGGNTLTPAAPLPNLAPGKATGVVIKAGTLLNNRTEFTVEWKAPSSLGTDSKGTKVPNTAIQYTVHCASNTSAGLTTIESIKSAVDYAVSNLVAGDALALEAKLTGLTADIAYAVIVETKNKTDTSKISYSDVAALSTRAKVVAPPEKSLEGGTLAYANLVSFDHASSGEQTIPPINTIITPDVTYTIEMKDKSSVQSGVFVGNNGVVTIPHNLPAATYMYTITASKAGFITQMAPLTVTVTVASSVPTLDQVNGSIAAGNKHTVLLKKDGTVWTWGNNDKGQLGNGSSGGQSTTPVQVGKGESNSDTPYLTGVTAIAAGYDHTVALKDGKVYDWGNNEFGQLGNDGTTGSNTPVQVSNLTGIIAIAAGGGINSDINSDINSGISKGYTIALKGDGTVWAWGNNEKRQLGLGFHEHHASEKVPLQVVKDTGSNSEITEGLTNIRAIAAGRYHAVALDRSGYIWIWGNNDKGQLGNSSTGGEKWGAVQVLISANIDKIAAGYDHTMALDTSGIIWTWGAGRNKQLGNNSNTDSNTPVQVVGASGSGTLSGIIEISAGLWHTVALKGDEGHVYTWGLNDRGQLGKNTSGLSKKIPVQVEGVANIKAIAAGGFHTVALKGDGTVYTWGFNNKGQLGTDTGSDDRRVTPVSVTIP